MDPVLSLKIITSRKDELRNKDNLLTPTFFILVSFFQLYFPFTYSGQSLLAGLLQAFKDNNDFILLSDCVTNSSQVLAVYNI